jgi:hypothetical protein
MSLLLLIACIFSISFAQVHPLSTSNHQVNDGILALEEQYHEITKSNEYQSLAFPTACTQLNTLTLECNPDFNLTLLDSSKNAFLKIQLLASYNYQNLDKTNSTNTDYGKTDTGKNISIYSTSPAIKIHSKINVLEAFLDASLHTEDQEKFIGSQDKMFIEKQNEGQNSNLNFISYARFTGGVALNTEFGRFSTQRNKLHWGPSLFYPLLLGQGAPPLNFISYKAKIGTFSITSIYGQLIIGDEGVFVNTTNERSVYAHRYEWKPNDVILLGVSETLILYKTNEPFAFTPIFPLFMFKGQTVEPNNNGNLAFDLSLTPINNLRFYSEFLIDDVSELSSLFDNFWGNKWALTLGSHGIYEFMKVKIGSILEWSRVEPWVYTHYTENTAQASHFNQPLGNPLGPNSQGFTLKKYIKLKNSLYFGLTNHIIWKGNDKGSALSDTQPDNNYLKKKFLDGSLKPQWTSKITSSYSLPHLSLFGFYELGMKNINLSNYGFGLQAYL